MQFLNDRVPWNVRALLDSTATPYTVAQYSARAAVYRQGDPCERVMYIESGRVWLAVTTHDGKQAICSLLATGAFMGEEALTGCAERRRSATAMTDTQVLAVSTAHMRRVLRSKTGLADRFIAHLLERRSRLEDTLTEQLLYSSEQRLSSLLLVLAECDAARPSRCELPDLSQEIIAEMVGTTRSRVNVFMSRFKKLGFLETHRGVLYVNPTRLSAVHGGGRDVSRVCGASRETGAEERHSPMPG